VAQPQLQRTASPEFTPAKKAKWVHEKHLLGAISRQRPGDWIAAGVRTLPLTPATLRKIGHTTFDVYDALLQLRGANLVTHASIAGIARRASAPVKETNGWPRKKLTYETVRNAIKKLIRLGLVENIESTYSNAVPCSCADKTGPLHFHRIFLRRVLGVIVPKPETPDLFHLLAPEATHTALQAAKTHGGARAGGGRPAGAKDKAPRARFRDPTLSMSVAELVLPGPATVAPITGQIGPSGRVVAPVPKPRGKAALPASGENQDARPIRSILETSPAASSKQQSSPPQKPGGVSNLSKEQKPPQTTAPKSGSRYPDRLPSVGGLRLGGGGLGQRALVAHAPRMTNDWVPPFPGPNVIASPRVPEPPRIDPELAPVDRAAALMRAFRTTITARYKFPCMTLANRDLSVQKEYPDLVKSAALLVELGIPPIAWVAWSVDQWRQFAAGSKPPSVRWVFSPARIEKWHGWFNNEQSGYRGGGLITVPAARELYLRFEQMKFALIRGASQADAIAEHLPRAEYERLVALARVQSAEIQLNLNRRLQAGHWLWT